MIAADLSSFGLTGFLVAPRVCSAATNTSGTSGCCSVINNIQNFRYFEDFVGAANVIRMRMRGDEIIELLHVVALQRIENNFAFACITSINQTDLPPGAIIRIESPSPGPTSSTWT